MSTKTKAAAMLLISIIALSCSKSGNSPSVDVADQFVGTYSGTLKVYSGGVLASTVNVSNYSITKASANEIKLNSEASPAPIGFVTGNTFSSNYSTSQSGAITATSMTANLVSGTLTETGTATETQGNVSATYTFSASYTKQ